MRPFRVPTRRPASPRPVLCEMLEPRVLLDAAVFPDAPVPLGSVPGGGSLSGTLWNDYDGDGVRDAGEPALAGWTVFLDANRNDRFDLGETVAFSGADGSYQFRGIPANEYQVGFVVPEGWTQTAPVERVYALYQTEPWGRWPNPNNKAQLAQVLPNLILRPLPAPVGSVSDPDVSSFWPAPQGLAVGSSSLFYIDGTVAPQVLWELGLGAESGPALTDPLVIDSDALALDEPAGGLAYLDGLVYISLPASNRLAVFDPVSDTIIRTMQVDVDIAEGLTGAGALGALFASTPGTAGFNARFRKIVALDLQTGEVQQEMQGALDKYVSQGWGVQPVQSMGYYQGRALAHDPMWTWWVVDPATGTVADIGAPASVARLVNAIGGDGAPRFARVRIAQYLEPVVDFAARPVTDAPASVDLLPGSDTGLSDDDDITSLNNSSAADALQFRVDGTIPGATVELYARGVVIGSAVATDTSTTITTNGTTPLLQGPIQDWPLDWTRSVWARQALPNQAPSGWSEGLTVEVDQLAPIVKSVKLDDGSAQRSLVRSLTVDLSEEVVLGAGSFELVNEATGQAIDPAAIAAHHEAGPVALCPASRPGILTLTFPGLPGGRLPDGRYTLRLKSAHIADPIGRPLSTSTHPSVGGVDYVYGFNVLAGDFDGNAAVDLADLAILASHWNQPGTTAEGDASGDGQIDLADLALLASNWNAPVGAPVGNGVETGNLSGALWEDNDGDGARDAGEPALVGCPVFLDANRNDRLDVGETFTLSGADGSYLFEGLPAGEYVVGFVVPEGWTQTAPAERLFVLYRDYSGQAQLAQALPGLVKRPLPAPVGAVVERSSSSVHWPAAQGLAVGSTSLFYIDGAAAQQTLWELDLGPRSGAALTDPLVLDSDALTLGEPAGGLAYLGGLVYISLPASNRIAVFDPVSDTILRTMQFDVDLAHGLTGVGGAGILLAATPPSTTEPDDRALLVVDPQSGSILRQFTCVTGIWYFDGWLYPGFQSIGYYDGRGVWADGVAGYIFIDPPEDAALGLSTQLLQTSITKNANAIGGDGAPRFARVQVGRDLQPVVDFAARRPITDAPTTVDLLPGSDTGLSDQDNITALNNANPEDTLQFRVDGTIPGATVELCVRGVVIGSALATGASTIVTTDGATPILENPSPYGWPMDWPEIIQARQALPDQLPSEWSEALTIEIDQLAPVVNQVWLDDVSPQRSLVRSLKVSFSEDVVLTVAAFELVNETTGQVVAPAAIAAAYAPPQLSTGRTYNVTLTFPGLPGQKLPDGRYTLRVKSAQVIDPIGRPLSSSTDPGVGAVDYVYSFHVLAGDFNGDATVDLADLAILASRWNQPGTISQGDASADGKIDLADLAILAANWNVTLPEPVAAASRATRPAARPAATVANPTPAPRVAARRTNGLIDERPVDLLVPVVPRVR